MAKCVRAGEVFSADAVRLDEWLNSIHADSERAKKLRHRFTFSLCEELSSCGRVVGNESARNAEAGARGES